MPATPSQLRRPIVVDYTMQFGPDVSVTFRYDRNKITEAWLSAWVETQETTQKHALNELLADILVGWDIFNEDGSPVPITVENISALFNMPDKNRMVEDMLTGAVPSEAEGKASSGRSPTPSTDSMLLPAMPQNGPVPSGSPVPSTSVSLT